MESKYSLSFEKWNFDMTDNFSGSWWLQLLVYNLRKQNNTCEKKVGLEETRKRMSSKQNCVNASVSMYHCLISSDEQMKGGMKGMRSRHTQCNRLPGFILARPWAISQRKSSELPAGIIREISFL